MNNHVPLLALQRRRLSDHEVVAAATEATPLSEDPRRAERRLSAAGWPVADSVGFLR